MARRFSTNESNLALLTAVLGNAPAAIEHYLPAAARPDARAMWLDAVWHGLDSAEPGSGAQLAFARAVGAAAAMDAHRATDLRALLDGTAPAPSGLALDADLRWTWWTALTATGYADKPDLDDELHRDDTATGRTAHLRAMTARPRAEVKAHAWATICADHTLTNDHLDATIGGFRAGARRDLTTPYDSDYFAVLRDTWSDRSIEIARRIVLGLFPPTDTLDQVDAWLAANTDAPGALRRLVVEQRDHLARDLRVQHVNEA